MAKPPDSGPHSDIGGVNRDARIGAPHVDPTMGDASDKARAKADSAATPEGEPPLKT